MLNDVRLKTGLLGALLLVLLGCDSQPKAAPETLFQGQTMGTTWSVKSVGQCSATQQMFDQRLIDINLTASTYIADSEISQLNRASEQVVPLSDDLATLIKLSLQVANNTDGRFDITVGNLVNLWGFGPDIRSTPPQRQTISQALRQVGYQALVLDGNQLRFDAKRTIDLSAIAKGWGVDQLGQILSNQGCANYLAEIGGELLAKGVNKHGQPWRVAVERPEIQGQSAMQVIQLDNQAVATSGDYRNFYKYEGKRYSHTIDPTTGYPVTHQVASVTVVATTSALADAYATALNVMGPQEGMQVARAQNLAVMFIEYEGESLKITANEAFKGLMR